MSFELRIKKAEQIVKYGICIGLLSIAITSAFLSIEFVFDNIISLPIICFIVTLGYVFGSIYIIQHTRAWIIINEMRMKGYWTPSDISRLRAVGKVF